ncbi:hypothetical protein [Robertkochia aurantiaca]|uniref:hypothetical protein n=1 Tax=Robertkochia aurantiaca TaxID=2873700 RepID=UPI001CCF6771|nr:hypothetical protein [Robertkochia sp. 3YJGBD-33]
MTKLYPLALVLLLLISCNEETDKKPLSAPEKIAYAHGFENWDKIEEIQFTFNVDRDTTHFERHWIWQPKSDAVTMIYAEDTVSYNRASIDSTVLQADKAFVNDVYWLLAPYKLVWDKGYEYEEPYLDKAPISNDSLQKFSIVYVGEGGYTPGDGYDFYLDQENKVKEWVYRKDNDTAVCMKTTWEDYENLEGLQIATMHQDETGKFKLYFTGLEVTASETQTP